MSDITQFISAIPKAELHVHIEGTIEADLLLTIADRNGIVLPYTLCVPVGDLAWRSGNDDRALGTGRLDFAQQR